MLQFKQYIEEGLAKTQTKMPEPPKRDENGKVKVMSGKEAMQHFPRASMNAIMRHPLYKAHIATSGHQGFAHSVEKVLNDDPKYDRHIVHAVTGGEHIRHRIDFHLGVSRRRVDHVEHFVNRNNEKDSNGRVVWKHAS